MNSLKQLRDIADPDQQFRQMTLLYSSLLQSEGIHARPFLSSSLPVFSALTAEAKSKSIAHISSALEIFEEVLAEGASLKDNSTLLWRAIRKLDYVPQSDIFDKIGDDVVIIYSPEQMQVFQNIRFFDFVSFTLEDLYSAQWSQYSRRDPAIEEKLFKMAVEVFTGKITGTVAPQIPEHFFEEVGTEELLKVSILMRYVSPLKRNGQIAGALVINHCKIKWPTSEK